MSKHKVKRKTKEVARNLDVCALLCEKSDYRMAWVGYAQEDDEQTVLPMAHAGFEEGYLTGITVSWSDDSQIGRGPIGTAIRTGITQLNQNFTNNPAVTPWSQAALERGYRSSIAVPFTKKSGVRGALTIYAGSTDAFSADEVVLLEELTLNLANGLDARSGHPCR